jgi:hypothetical protein
MKNLVNTMHETTIQPIMNLGWKQVYELPWHAAAAVDPTATIITTYSEIETHQMIELYRTRTGPIAVRPWYEIVPFQDEPEIVGYIHDQWVVIVQ